MYKKDTNQGEKTQNKSGCRASTTTTSHKSKTEFYQHSFFRTIEKQTAKSIAEHQFLREGFH